VVTPMIIAMIATMNDQRAILSAMFILFIRTPRQVDELIYR
jgi:hypothetical protein